MIKFKLLVSFFIFFIAYLLFSGWDRSKDSESYSGC